MLKFLKNNKVLLSGDSGGHFTIANTKSCEGTIYTTGIPTDREINPVLNLTVQASDRGSPPHTVCVHMWLINYLHAYHRTLQLSQLHYWISMTMPLC